LWPAVFSSSLGRRPRPRLRDRGADTGRRTGSLVAGEGTRCHETRHIRGPVASPAVAWPPLFPVRIGIMVTLPFPLAQCEGRG